MSHKSLFISVRDYKPQYLKEALEDLRIYHRGDDHDRIINLVLTGVQGRAGFGFNSNMDIIRPYLPGGDKKACDNVFIGVRPEGIFKTDYSLPSYQQRSPYAAGTLDASYRWKQLTEQRQTWEQVSERYPDLTWHAYIDYEAVLEWWVNSDIANAYKAYLIQSVKDAGDRAVLWSPSFWADFHHTGSGTKDLIAVNIQKVFRDVGHNRMWLHLQDKLGSNVPGVTTEDAIGWYNLLKNCGYKFASLAINMELFNLDDYSSVTEAVRLEREVKYAAAGVPLGAAWSMRYWMKGHEHPTPEAQPDETVRSPLIPSPPNEVTAKEAVRQAIAILEKVEAVL